MQERGDLSPTKINADLLDFTLHTPLWFWIVAFVLSSILGVAAITYIFILYYGLELLGYQNTIVWGFLITNFVFWVGISHAGVMISAILRLSQAEWRRPITRAAEVMTVFALATAAMFPVLHTGRPWRTLYWAFPYDYARGIFPDVRSALIWDPSAIFTYLSSSAAFVYVALIPDLAVARDMTTGWQHTAYSILALGFQGTGRQWKLQTTAGILLSALILPVFVSVHSIVSWDFAMAILPGYHATVFPPYFVIGAVHSGVSAVATLMAIVRKIFHLEDYITPDHFDALGRLLTVVATGWLYFFLMDVFFGMVGEGGSELSVWTLRFFDPPFNLLIPLMLICSYLIPVPLWLFRKMRRNVTVMFWSSITVNIGMWIERYYIIVPPQSFKQPFTFIWVSQYLPRWSDWVLVIASFALVSFGVLIFAKLFPIIPLFDIKEGQVMKQTLRIGRARVPAVIRE